MPYLLHLSDLHLSLWDESDEVGDYKRNVIPAEARQRGRRILESTLHSVSHRMEEQGIVLDAVVITGDVTYQHRTDGFEILTATLERGLGERLPDVGRIVVVPGNHDVAWEAGPGTPERYDRFLRHVRSQGYVTPMLEGIDLNVEGERISAVDPLLVGSDESYAVVAVNSTDFCGVIERLEGLDGDDLLRLEELAVGEPLLKRVRAELHRLTLFDIARVSQPQLTAVGGLLNDLRRRMPPPSEGGPLRIAALHHQLLPVSSAEEVKPYETMVNLGEFREFLRSNEFSIVLHGHKHVNRLYWDHHYRGGDQRKTLDPGSGWPIFVCSSGAIEGFDSEIAKLIEIPERQRTRPRRQVMRISHIDAVGPGAQGREQYRMTRVRLPRAGQRAGEPHSLFEGLTASEVYAQVRERFDEVREGGRLHHVICHVVEGQSGKDLPLGYPEMPGHEDPARWLDDTVAWWSKETSKLWGLRFTHGERIHSYAQTIDQLANCVATIKADTGTGRAIVSLFDPRVDEIKRKGMKFPSFTSLQFVVREERWLDCIAHFRVQEMKYWWPVNLCELARLQEEVIARLHSERVELAAGAILTITGVAHVLDTPPKVLVPLIDRLFEDDQDRLRSMAEALFRTEARERARGLDDWSRILEDWVPADRIEVGGVPVPVTGLEALRNEVNWRAREYGEAKGDEVVRILDRMIEDNMHFLDSERLDSDHHRAWRNWSVWTRQSIAHLLQAIDAMR